MGTCSNLLLSLILSVILLSGIASFQPFAFADNEPKTLESECAEELDDDDIDLEGLFCLAIFTLQQSIADLQNQFDVLFVQKDLDTPVLFLQVDPNSREPALVVNDGTNDVFTVNKDGSIQIGSSTVVLNPDGTVTGGPLLLLAGSKVDGKLISTEPDEDTLAALILGPPPCNQKDLAQFLGGKWKCSSPTSVVAGAGGDPFTDKTYLSFTKLSTSPVIDIPDGFSKTNPVILAKWTITNDRTGLIGRSSGFIANSAWGAATLNADAFTFCQAGWVGRVDGGPWLDVFGITVSPPVQFPPNFSQEHFSFMSSLRTMPPSLSEWKTFEFAVGGFQFSSKGTTCHLRDAHFSAWIELPATATIVRDI